MGRILSIGGIIDNNETILGVANNKKNLSYLEKYEIQKITEGITAGIGAQFFILEKEYPIYLILVPFLQTKNYDAAAKAIGLLNKMYGLNIDNKPLLAESKKLSGLVNTQMKEVKEREESGHNMYI
jgi:predicted ATP-grasp superfamily ATP-dependent carboligase